MSPSVFLDWSVADVLFFVGFLWIIIPIGAFQITRASFGGYYSARKEYVNELHKVFEGNPLIKNLKGQNGSEQS